ncbi:MAG: hypothetical protein E5X43_09405 [Mesorhizobium sp.]|uniref:hypothetical protein n=1 Tax=unclassified Mesorhizobium TaxID=325217 RepID=UPI000FCC8E32|nr:MULTISPECIES: hypothetical protein [unclassified Mesorhizobium]RUV49570.1 hypothetical protein EOA85_31940 [Mesorhizobium sp. M5C.F.Ca.IN.020.29.1.1]RWH81301.1 MAG: hypothetical protein EOQ85_09745 [Mesorhizobium sp.]RWH85726.1 MAG: hypothetical protein EOQ86_06045 [Mesorhizobium sp.]RWH90983.1 MAG: hypothetical protein EOQ87_09700 [Mesorhizobium sp.]RWH99665.1 MAG: hypothetical protein EOQ88_09805 [Mesorhizobium sp.]
MRFRSSTDQLTYAAVNALRMTQAAQEEAMRRLTTVTSIEEGHTRERHGIADADGGSRSQRRLDLPGACRVSSSACAPNASFAINWSWNVEAASTGMQTATLSPGSQKVQFDAKKGRRLPYGLADYMTRFPSASLLTGPRCYLGGQPARFIERGIAQHNHKKCKDGQDRDGDDQTLYWHVVSPL